MLFVYSVRDPSRQGRRAQAVQRGHRWRLRSSQGPALSGSDRDDELVRPEQVHIVHVLGYPADEPQAHTVLRALFLQFAAEFHHIEAGAVVLEAQLDIPRLIADPHVDDRRFAALGETVLYHVHRQLLQRQLRKEGPAPVDAVGGTEAADGLLEGVQVVRALDGHLDEVLGPEAEVLLKAEQVLGLPRESAPELSHHQKRYDGVDDLAARQRPPEAVRAEEEAEHGGAEHDQYQPVHVGERVDEPVALGDLHKGDDHAVERRKRDHNAHAADGRRRHRQHLFGIGNEYPRDRPGEDDAQRAERRDKADRLHRQARHVFEPLPVTAGIEQRAEQKGGARRARAEADEQVPHLVGDAVGGQCQRHAQQQRQPV